MVQQLKVQQLKIRRMNYQSYQMANGCLETRCLADREEKTRRWLEILSLTKADLLLSSTRQRPKR